MNKNVFVFIPNTLKTNKPGYLKGCYRKFEDCEAFYITDDIVSNNYGQSIGYVGRSFRSSSCRVDHYLFISNSSNKISINSDDSYGQSVVDIIYDYHSFKNSDIICRKCDNYGKHFKLLAEELKKFDNDGIKENGRKSITGFIAVIIIYAIDIILKVILWIWTGNEFVNLPLQVIDVVKPVLLCSAIFLHFEENMLNLRWFLKETMQNKKLSPKTGNMLVAKIIDLLIGVILLNWCLKYESDILNFIQTTIEVMGNIFFYKN